MQVYSFNHTSNNSENAVSRLQISCVLKISFIKCNTRQGRNSIPVMIYSGAAYPYVPIMRVETCDLSPTGPSLASPKSDSFALYSWLSKS